MLLFQRARLTPCLDLPASFLFGKTSLLCRARGLGGTTGLDRLRRALNERDQTSARICTILFLRAKTLRGDDEFAARVDAPTRQVH